MNARARPLRRRSRPSLVVRVRAFWIVGLFTFVAVACIAVAVVNAPFFRVRNVDVSVPLGSAVGKEEVTAAAHIEPDANIWLLNTGAIRRRVEAIPYVNVASVHRFQFPRPAVTLDVSIRAGTGCVLSSRGAMTIDAGARVLQVGCPVARLPRVDIGDIPAAVPGDRLTAPEIGALLADARIIGAHLSVRSVRRDRFGEIEAVDARGVTIKFGFDHDLERKLALVEPVRRSAGAGRKLRAIDLRKPDTPVVEFP